MPHQCTSCGRTFPDGSKEMLSGCSSCGGNKFQFKPSIDDEEQSTTPAAGTTQDSTAESPGAQTGGNQQPARSNKSMQPDSEPPTAGPESEQGGVTGTVADAADTVRDWVGTDDGTDERTDSRQSDDRQPEIREQTTQTAEDTAQADARSGVVDPDAIPESATGNNDATPARNVTFDETDAPGSRSEQGGVEPGTSTPPEDEQTPDLDALREELNQQFESIRIVAPGQYELNLMELYDREEYIISLLEDGRYAIEVPEAWRDSVE